MIEDLARIRKARAALEDAPKARHTFEDSIPTVMVMREGAQSRQAYVIKRGAYDAHGDPVSPATPSFLPPMSRELRATGSDSRGGWLTVATR